MSDLFPEAMPPGDYARIILGVTESRTNLRHKMRRGLMPSQTVKVVSKNSLGKILSVVDEQWVTLSPDERKPNPTTLSNLRRQKRNIKAKYQSIIEYYNDRN